MTEFSKKVLIFSAALAALVTVTGVVLACAGQAVDLMMVIIPLSWTPLDLTIGFYFWKAKNENRAKYQQRFMTKWAKEYGVESALRAAEIVLKD